MLFSVMNISACNEIIQKSQTFTKIIKIKNGANVIFKIWHEIS